MDLMAASASASATVGGAKVRHLDDCDGASSQFSESNPLAAGDGVSFPSISEPKVPQTIAKTGWQRTVAMDSDFDSSIPVVMGVPGTGLAKARQHSTKALAPTLGRGKPPQEGLPTSPFTAIAAESWGDVRVTREDRREAKALRKLEPAPGAAPLPSPRFMSETDESSVSESMASTAKRRPPFETQSSTASSDLNFLISTATTGTFGVRSAKFGRAVEPRIPATVGEGRLHNSLATYFGQKYREGESAGGSRASSVSYDGGKDRNNKVTAAAAVAGGGGGIVVLGRSSSSPLAIAETRETSLTGSPADYYCCDEEQQEVGEEESKRECSSNTRVSHGGGVVKAGGGGPSRSVLVGGSGGVTKPAKHAKPATHAKTVKHARPARPTRPAKTANAAKRLCPTTDRSTEEGRGYAAEDDGARFAGKEGSAPDDCIEPGRRGPKCNCLKAWPWKLLFGVVMLVAAVAIVVVVNEGGGVGSRRRLAPTTPGSMLRHTNDSVSKGGGGAVAGAGAGGGAGAALDHSGRVLSLSRTAWRTFGRGGEAGEEEGGSRQGVRRKVRGRQAAFADMLKRRW